MKDINGCSDGCVNTAGSYYCTCPTGYELSNDYRTCVGELTVDKTLSSSSVHLFCNTYKCNYKIVVALPIFQT